MNKGREEGKNKQTNEQVFKRKKERMDVIMDYVNAWCQPQGGYWKFRGGGGSKGNYELKLDFPEGWG